MWNYLRNCLQRLRTFIALQSCVFTLLVVRATLHGLNEGPIGLEGYWCPNSTRPCVCSGYLLFEAHRDIEGCCVIAAVSVGWGQSQTNTCNQADVGNTAVPGSCWQPLFVVFDGILSRVNEYNVCLRTNGDFCLTWISQTFNNKHVRIGSTPSCGGWLVGWLVGWLNVVGWV